MHCLRFIAALLAFGIAGQISADDVMKAAISTPKPEYPYAARYHYIEGAGSYIVRLHTPSGRVKQVTVVKTTGSSMLDQAAVTGLKKWRFKPGAVAPMSRYAPGFKDRFANEDRLFKVPVTFVMKRYPRSGTFVVRQPL